MRNRRSHSLAFSIPELLIVSFLFSGFMAVSYLLLDSGLRVWRKTAASQDIHLQLLRARSLLRRDLAQANFSCCKVSSAPGVEAVGRSGDVLWMLSGEDPSSGELARTKDGLPFWQRNVVYYLSVPAKHDRMFGAKCNGEYAHCPHKFLLRRQVDSGSPTTPSSRLEEIEMLLTPGQLKPFLLVPEDERTIPGGDEFSEVVATGLLDFQVKLGPEPQWAEEVRVELVGLATEDAGKQVDLGSERLRESVLARSLVFSVAPGNASQ